MKFRVLAGKHSQKDSKGKVRVFTRGEVVETNTDLEKKFNGSSEGTRKFQKLDDDAKADRGHYIGGGIPDDDDDEEKEDLKYKSNPAVQQKLPPKQEVANQPKQTSITPQLSAKLDSMSLKDLQTIAREQGVDFKEDTKREDLVKSIKSSLPK